jgi:lactoylglutathione lyase
MPNLKQAVPFFLISDMESSLRFYLDGLGFEMTIKWIDEGKLRWCWLQREGVAIMLQEFKKQGNESPILKEKLGEGVTICIICEDAPAIYHELIEKGIQASEPFVGNKMWVTSVSDPDGFRIDFESMTEVPEETRFSEWKG